MKSLAQVAITTRVMSLLPLGNELAGNELAQYR